MPAISHNSPITGPTGSLNRRARFLIGLLDQCQLSAIEVDEGVVPGCPENAAYEGFLSVGTAASGTTSGAFSRAWTALASSGSCNAVADAVHCAR